MTNFTQRLVPRTITAQITMLVIAAVLLGVALTSGISMYLLYDKTRVSTDLMVATAAARIATIVKEAEASRSPIELSRVLSSARWPGMRVAEVPAVYPAPLVSITLRDRGFVSAIALQLGVTWGIVAVPYRAVSTDKNSIIIQVSDKRAFVFEPAQTRPLHTFMLIQAAFGLAIVVVIILFLAVYAVRWITSPLSSIASAARLFGRSLEDDRRLSERGPHEIAEVAIALNDMRTRVRSLVDERTRMLAAISHDLRTPLTRLRLRTERLVDDAMRRGMLHDIGIASEMIGEALIYLKEGGRNEALHLVDLPSLLQTICTEFSDVGHTVAYQGAGRFAFPCHPTAVTRAVTNVVDNGTKHGSTVVVILRALDNTQVRIDVSDNGPGIPAPLREKVFEPFFKGDTARPSSGRNGFGLGLSIARDAIERNGGKVELLSNAAHGLTVRISLTSAADIAAATRSPLPARHSIGSRHSF
jgi:signal transduction histidine kinase